MTIRIGATGANVRLIQQALHLALTDGIFGGGTASAVKQFQRDSGLPITGIVDQATWTRLLPGQPFPESPLAHAPLVQRCLALTGSFETSVMPPDCFAGLTGDFDGQGLSFGVLQWNIGQGSLQVLLKEAFAEQTDLCKRIFQERFDTIVALGGATLPQQLTFARSIQTRGVINEPWNGMLKTLGLTPEFQAIESRHAQSLFQQGLALCAAFGLKSQRAAALMFDIMTQNGGIGPITKAEIQADFSLLPGGGGEVDRMRIVANRVASHSRPEFADDVRTRKLAVAEGGGTVHHVLFDLEDTFSITLDPIA